MPTPQPPLALDGPCRTWARRKLLGAVVIALGLTPLAGCAACGNPFGCIFSISYTFDVGASCDEGAEGVLEIETKLQQDGESEVKSVPCNNEGGMIRFSSDGFAGTYSVSMRGIDAERDAVLDNLGGNSNDETITTTGRYEEELLVVLDLTPARLNVDFVVWVDGGIVECDSDSTTIKGLRVEAASGTHGRLLVHDFGMCDFDGVLGVPDDERKIDGRLFDRAVFLPLDANGAPVGQALGVQFTDPVGAGKSVAVVVECEFDVCEIVLVSGAKQSAEEG